MMTADIKPPMFSMEPPFSNMGSGKVRILHAGGEILGDLIPYHCPGDHLFGARIDIVGPIICGSSAVIGFKLSQNLLQQIQRNKDAGISYALTIRENLNILFPFLLVACRTVT